MGTLFSFLEIQRDENISLKALDKKTDEENGIETIPEKTSEDESLPPPPKLERLPPIIFKTPVNTGIMVEVNNSNESKFEQLPDCEGASSVYYGKGINTQGDNVYFLSIRAKIYDDCPNTANEIIARGGNNLKILKGPLDPDEYKPYDFNFTGQDFLDF